MTTESKRVPVFDLACTKGVCDVLAGTDWPGLSGSEIEGLLPMVRVSALEPGSNKRERLYFTLHNKQVADGAGNVLTAFIARAMSPARYAQDISRFLTLQDQLNEFLVFYGYRVRDDGRLGRAPSASTIEEAARLAGQLITELRRRGTHEEVLRHCDEEVMTRSLFHATSEASKSVPARVRSITGLTGDGATLYDVALGTQNSEPALYINGFRTESEISEHRGFKHLLLGIHGHYRNPRAHSVRIESTEARADLLDMLGLVSYVHRRLDAARLEPLPVR